MVYQLMKKILKNIEIDVFRLLQILSPDNKITTPESILNDVNMFTEAMKSENIAPVQLGYKNRTKENLISELSAYYDIDD